jgi:hypothetical protein
MIQKYQKLVKVKRVVHMLLHLLQMVLNNNLFKIRKLIHMINKECSNFK